MTQPEATTPPAKRPPRPTRTTQRPAPNTRVRDESTQTLGTVQPSDDWWDTLQLRGVSPSGQVLVEWDSTGGTPVRNWIRVSDLELVQ
jgi:hypothetical protein